MTIRDIFISLGYQEDDASRRRAESSVNSLKSFATKALGAIGLAFTVSGLKDVVSACVDIASEAEETQNKFDVVFQGMTEDVENWAESYANSIGRTSMTIKTYLADEQNLLVGMGMERKQGAELAEQMTSLALDLASFNNIDEDAAVEAMTKALMGESESAKTLGAVLNDNTRAVAMQTLGLGDNYQALSEVQKMQVNYQAILAQSADAIGDCERSVDSYKGTSLQLEAILTDTKQVVGQFFMPALKEIKKLIIPVVKGLKETITKLTGTSEETNVLVIGINKLKDVINKIRPPVQKVFGVVKTVFVNTITFIRNLVNKLGGIQKIIRVVAIAMSMILVYMKAGKIIAGIKAIGAAITGLNVKMLILIAVVIMIALIIDDFINFMQGNNSVMGQLFERAGINAEDVRDRIRIAWKTVTIFLSNAWKGIKAIAMSIFNALAQFWQNHGDQIINIARTALSIAGKVISTMLRFIVSLVKGAISVAKSVIENGAKAWTAIKNAISNTTNFIKEHKTAVELAAVAIGTITALVIAYNAASIAAAVSSGAQTVAIMAMYAADGIAAIAQGALTAATTLWSTVAGVATTVTTALGAAIAFLTSPIGIVIVVIGALIAIGIALYNNWDTIKAKATEIFTNISTVVKEKVGKIKDDIVNGFNAAIEFITSLPSKALKWGSDIIDGIVDGIKSAIGKVGDAVKGVADTITSFLHFSVPDEGPLADYESWMPDMMSGLAQGIQNSMPVLRAKVVGAADMISRMGNVTADSDTASNAAASMASSSKNITQNNSITNNFSGSDRENISTAAGQLEKSGDDLTKKLSRGLAYC